jgi:hypothetical protein
MENIPKILENCLIAWNNNHKPALEYSNVSGSTGGNGLRLLGKGNSVAILCTKSHAIDILGFLTSLEYEKESKS